MNEFDDECVMVDYHGHPTIGVEMRESIPDNTTTTSRNMWHLAVHHAVDFVELIRCQSVTWS